MLIRKRMFYIITIFLLSLILVLPGCTSAEIMPDKEGAQPVTTPPFSEQEEAVTPPSPPESEPTPPGPVFDVDLSLSDNPELNKPVKVTAVFTMTDIHDMTPPVEVPVSILLPYSFVLVEGQLESSQSMSPGDVFALEATIKAIEVCEQQKIVASTSGGRATIYVAVFSDRAFWSDKGIEFGGESEMPAIMLISEDDTVMTLELSLSNAPALGETAEIIVLITAINDAPDTIVGINIPEGLQLVSGEKIWQGDLTKGDQAKFRVTVKAVQTGKWHLAVTGSYCPTPTHSVGAWVDALNLYIFEDHAEIYDVPAVEILPEDNGEPPPVKEGDTEPMPQPIPAPIPD